MRFLSSNLSGLMRSRQRSKSRPLTDQNLYLFLNFLTSAIRCASLRIVLSALPNTHNWTMCCVPTAADTGCCALEIRKCQPQYRIQQHKLTQQHLIRSPTRLNYCTHAVKTKRGNYNVQDQKRG